MGFYLFWLAECLSSNGNYGDSDESQDESNRTERFVNLSLSLSVIILVS